MKKATKVMLGLVAVLVALSMIGCGGEVDLTPTYLFQKTATIDAAEGTVTLEENDVTWSIKGCDNGDTDPNNDLATYDASDKIYLDGNVVKVKDGYNTDGKDVVVRVFGTSTKDSYLYGWYDITLKIEAPVIVDPADDADPKIGNLDLTTGLFGARSDFWAVPNGESRTVTFKNYSSKEQVWNNFLVVLTDTDVNPGAENEYIVARADNWYWKGVDNADNLPFIRENNWNWETIKDDLHGAFVAVKVTNKGTTADIEISVKTLEEKEYYQNYKEITLGEAAVEKIYLNLSVEKACLTEITLVENEPPVSGQVATGSWDFADLATVTVDYADGATKIESAEALAAAASVGTAMPEKKFYLKGDVEYSSTTGSMKAVVKSLDEEGLPILYNKYEATKDLGEFSVGCLQGTKDFMVVEKVQGPFTVTMNYSTNSKDDKTDRYAYIKINGEENKDSAYPESVPAAGSTMTVDYTGTDVVDVVFGATNSVRVYDVTFTAK